MNKQNDMMNFVWLLNAADNSAFETKELWLEFLRQRQNFQDVRQSVLTNTPQGDYLEREIQQNLENLQSLQKTVGDVIEALRLHETGGSNNER
jgi:hypothetical protein